MHRSLKGAEHLDGGPGFDEQGADQRAEGISGRAIGADAHHADRTTCP
jgi:hypothetical protein